MRRLTLILILSLACNVSVLAYADAELVVVTHKENPVGTMSRSQLIDLFMGKYVAYPDGRTALPVDNNTLKSVFYSKLVGLSVARVNAYWSRIQFTGRARPPMEHADHQSIVDYVKVHKNAIAYIPKSQLTDELKVVFVFNE